MLAAATRARFVAVPLRRRPKTATWSADAQRTLYAARQSLVATQLAEQANRVTLYKVLGGGWSEAGQ